MGTQANPIVEFTGLCRSLQTPTDVMGSDFLAKRFDVEAWSTDFLNIMLCLHQRMDAIRTMIGETDLDESEKGAAFQRLALLRQAFGPAGLNNGWSHALKNYLHEDNILPIKMFSAWVQNRHGYTIPTDEELASLKADVSQLVDWLAGTELTERDFIRMALIEGLKGFLFRLERIGWYGWPGAIASLRSVIEAYLALERNQPNPNESPIDQAILQRVGAVLKSAFEHVKFAKDVQELGDWLLSGYGALCSVAHQAPRIAGFLAHLP